MSIHQPYTYILYSESLDRYYTGATKQSVEERLKHHLGNHKGFTSKAKDRIAIFSHHCDNYTDSLALERRIKKRGAKRFLTDELNC